MARGTKKALIIDMSSKGAFRKSRNQFKRTRDYFVRQDEFLDELKSEIERDFLRPMLKELKEYPNSRRYPEDYPIKFVSKKQRNYVMMLIKGKPRKRSGSLKNNWRGRVFKQAQGLNLKVYNKSPYAKYVVGKIGVGKSQRSIRRYTKQMQPFHKETGWEPAHTTIVEYYEEIKEYARKRADEWYKKGLDNF